MTARKLKTAVRKRQIAEAALALAATHGVRKLSMAAVSRRVGFVPSALYRHFKGKDEILDAILDLIQEKFRRNIQAVREETPDPLKRLRSLLMRHIRMVRENRGIPRVIFSEDYYNGRPRRRLRVYHVIRGYLVQVAGILREGQKRGLVSGAFSPWTGAVMFLGLVQPSVILWHMSGGEFDIAGQAERAWPVFLKAIRK